MDTILQILDRDSPLVVLGVYDAISAKIAEKVGFEVAFQTGYGTSASLFGMPDYGFVGATETVDNARRICNAVQIPVIIDIDTGYGNALSVRRVVQALESAGASGIFLEDQRWPKRCGHMTGKEVIPQAEYEEKLRAALDTRSSSDFVVVARTDSRATGGIDEAIERATRNREIGADIIFVEAPRSIDEMRRIGREIRAPLVANMIEGGATPLLPANDLYGMGFNLILYPVAALFASSLAIMRLAKSLKETGGTRGLEEDMLDFDQFNDLVRLSEYKELEKRYSSI